MLHRLLFFMPVYLLAQPPLEPQSMLYQADWIAKKYATEVAKAPPPAPSPQSLRCLELGNVWFTLDLNEIESPALTTLNDELLWDHLRELGVQSVYFKGLKQGGNFRTGLQLDPKWGPDWENLVLLLEKKGISLVGDSIGKSTGLSADFWLALKNFGDYPGLYHLVEIEKRDWKWLPKTAPAQFAANIPWLSLQELYKKGYVPEQFAPYVKQSQWNATPQVKCADGKVRRWIYLIEDQLNPVIDWLNPTFAGFRIASADTLNSIYELGQRIFRIDASLSSNAKETLSLWTRKLGAFSVQEGKGCIEELKSAPTDLVEESLTRPALLHALMAEDAEALKLMYRLFLEEEIETRRLTHVLQPFDEFTCDWSELLQHPKKRYRYLEETLTGEALRARLLKKDLECTTWPGLCMSALGIKDFEKKREDIAQMHLLLAFFYALQPGVFSFSASDLLGTLSHQVIDLMQPTENTLYASLPGQFTNPKSFAMQLKKILGVRRDLGIERGELVAIPATDHPGLMLLVHRLKESQMLQLLAVNFSRTQIEQVLDMAPFRHTTAIDLMTGLAEKKPLDSSKIFLRLPALTGKVLLFQTKYYD